MNIDKQFFLRLARQLRMIGTETKVTDSGIYGLSQIDTYKAYRLVKDLFAEESIYNEFLNPVARIAGYRIYQGEWVSADSSSFVVSASFAESNAGTLISISCVKYPNYPDGE